MTTAALTTIEGVELMAVGRWFPFTSRPSPDGVDITTSFLQGLVDAYGDPEVQSPRIKLGHVSALNDQLGDGEPAFGSITNLRLSDDGMTLIGDFANVPEWLATAMPSAYPSRSVEIDFRSSTPSGKTYDAVLTGCALLGAAGPAITCLEDIQALYGDKLPDTMTASAQGKVELVSQMAAAAATDIDTIRRAYYDSLSSEQMWWWIRSFHIDPAELIVDNDDGTLYRVPYTIASNGDVAFDEPVPVQVEYVDKPKMAAAAIRASHGSVVAVFGSRSESRPNSPTKQEDSMALTPENLARLGLAEDATEQQINEAVAASLAAPSAPATTETPAGGGTSPQPIGPAYPQPSGVPPLGTETVAPAETGTPAPEAMAAAAAANGAVVIDSAAWAAHQERLAATEDQLKASAERERIATRDKIVNDALAAGKFPPARVEAIKSLYDMDPEGTTAHLQTLQAGMIPTSERGGMPAPNDGSGDDTDAYPNEWLSARERTRLESARQGVYQHAEV